jgi:hypothetical protein
VAEISHNMGKNADLCQKPGQKIRVCRKNYNFLLKRNLAVGVYIKIVGQSLSFHMSGQQTLNSILIRS